MENNLHFVAKNKKDKLFLGMTIFILTLIFGGLFLGLLTGARNEFNTGTIPNPYFMILFGTGFALFGTVFVILFWRHKYKLWIILGMGVMAIGTMLVLSEIERIFRLEYIFSTGNMRLDQFLYACLAPIFLCIVLGTIKFIKRLHK